MKPSVNGSLQGIISRKYVGAWTEDKRIWSYVLTVKLNGHQKLVAKSSYFTIISDPTTSFINERSALHSVKTTAISLNADILNLSEYESRCPSCTSHVLTEEVEGEFCCLNCGEEGPKSMFASGGYSYG